MRLSFLLHRRNITALHRQAWPADPFQAASRQYTAQDRFVIVDPRRLHHPHPFPCTLAGQHTRFANLAGSYSNDARAVAQLEWHTVFASAQSALFERL